MSLILEERPEPILFFGDPRGAAFLKLRHENIFAIRGGLKQKGKQPPVYAIVII